MSVDRFAAAQAALNGGRLDEAASELIRTLSEEPEAPIGAYRQLAMTLFQLKDWERAEPWTKAGLARAPRDFDLMNLLGVVYRRMKRAPEAIATLNDALKLQPKNAAALSNLGNVYNDIKDARAIDVFTKLVRQKPTEAEFQRQLGRAYWFQGDHQKAEMRLSLAVKLNSQLVDGWLDLVALAQETRDPASVLQVLDRAITALPGSIRLAEARAVALRRSSMLKEAEAYLEELLKQHPNEAWIYYQLGGVVGDVQRERATELLNRAIELAPQKLDYRLALAENLSRARYGDEGDNVEQSYLVLNKALEDLNITAKDLPSGPLKVACEILGRVAAYDQIEALGSFDQLGRIWADAGRHTAMLAQLGRVQTYQDRLDLLEHHRIWGRLVDKAVAVRPIQHRGPRTPNGKIRVGIMSSDLRAHPVAYFAMPMLQHYDRSKFEVYCYSYFQGEEDRTQQQITQLVDAFRWRQHINDHDAAQMIADDQLDILIELGGSTHMNKLAVMGYKPAPLQASWLGYPHSAGLEQIDYLILDPFVQPTSRDLLIEEPLLMPKSWIAMGERAFPERPITPGTPQERNGFLTFGTANNPYKYNRKMMETWARTVAAVPGSRFLFVRPECGTPTFRANVTRIFESQGVSADRIRFEAIRGQHMPFYNEMDLSLDTFPQTGGTTTCEALWMGVPVVTVAGDAMFERLSHSILTNAGLADLSAESPEALVDVALKLAADHERRKHLRTELRSMLKASPLGQTERFAADFFAMLERAVTERGLAPAAA